MGLQCKDDLLLCKRNEFVPENPTVEERGIVGLLRYRTNKNKMHPDSIYQGYDELTHKYFGKSKTAEYFEELYGVNPFEIGSSDTIFNCWSFLKRFLLGVVEGKSITEENVIQNIDAVFEGYSSIRTKLDRLADYHHSLANFMPAPVGFNGNRSHDGKGNYFRDNDMPDVYYKRAEADFPEMYQWINDYVEEYSLQFFNEFESYLIDGKANLALDVTNDEELVLFEKSIDNAIACIEQRADNLWKHMMKQNNTKGNY
ncbi:MAG: hypothetical protein K5675_07510 [Lachnospiraceae bacterium]|nr:hypothetical protein [Lachnospiraceae bacterium]